MPRIKYYNKQTNQWEYADSMYSGDSSNNSGGNVDLTGYATEQWVREGYQPKGEYLTEVPDGYAKTGDIPTKPEDIGAQPAGNYALRTEIPAIPVQSVNGMTGVVRLSAADVKARPETWTPTAQDVGALPNTYTPPDQTAEQVGALPIGGGDMTGNINMNGQRLYGLNPPVDQTDAISKGYADSTFTQLTVLWENASPASEMGNQNIALNTDDVLYLLEYYTYGTTFTEFAFLRRGKTSRIHFFANASGSGVYTNIATKDIKIEGGNMAITDTTIKPINSTDTTTANGYLRPFRVFAVKGGSV